MSIPDGRPLRRRPIHPGEILREDFMPDYDLSVSGLASALGVSRQSVNGLVRERRAVSSEMALRLAKLLGNSPDFWLNLQRSVDLWDARVAIEDDMRRITPLRIA
jgi:antitoxin HigA-1